MTNPNYTHLGLVVDRSGSMSGLAADMNTAIRFLLKEQAQEPGQLVVDIVTFDNTYAHVVQLTDVAEVPDRDYVEPRGATALNDTLAYLINNLGTHFAQMDEGERPSKVIIAVVTDGYENASKEFYGEAGTARVKAMMDRQRDTYGWEFLFLASDTIDAFEAAGAYGVPAAQTMSFANTGTGATNVAVSASAYLLRTRSGETDNAFTEEEREESKKR